MKRYLRWGISAFLVVLWFYYWEWIITVAETVTFTYNILLIPLAIALFKLGVVSLEKDIKYYKYVFPLGIVCSLALVWGIQCIRMQTAVSSADWDIIISTLSSSDYRAQELNFRSIDTWLACASYAVLLAMLFGRAFTWLDKRNESGNSDIRWMARLTDLKRFTLLSAAALLVAWLPVWLASYPGFFCYDVGAQYTSFIEGTMTRQHSVLHTILLGVILQCSEQITGSANPGIAVLTWLQMIFLALVFSYVLHYMRKCGAKPAAVLGGWLVFAFLPTIQIYVVCTTKDLIFTGLFMLAVIQLIQWFRESEEYWRPLHRKILFGLTLFMMMAFRNNAVYAIVVFLILALLLFKARRKVFCAIFLGAIAVYFIYNGPVLDAFGIGNVSVQESLSVPLQQLGRVYVQNVDSFTEEDKDFMFSLIKESSWQSYQPKTADSVKSSSFDEEFYEENKAEFWGLWFRTALKNPGRYLEAFMLMTVDSWCPNSVIDGYIGYFYDRDFVQTSYFFAQVDEPGEHESKFPWLYRQIINIGYHISFEKIPVLSMLFSVGAMFWLFLFVLCYTIYRKEKQFWIPLLLIGLIYCTYLLGPMVLVRYHLILFFMIPVYFWMLSAVPPVRCCVESRDSQNNSETVPIE